MWRRLNSYKAARLLFPWLCFWTLFAWGWRVRNIFTHVPGYGDALEVLWGIRWYYETLLVSHSSPLFTSLVFHPVGWHTATLAHTPLLFLLALPLNIFGGLAFAYNLLAISALIVSFAGMLRFAKLFTAWPVATLAALAYTFWTMVWRRVEGHLHTEWMAALLPWLAWGMVCAQRSDESGRLKWVFFAGLIWGLMINFALYGIFIGAFTFLLWGRWVFRRIPQAILAVGIAALIGLPTSLLYWWGIRQDHTRILGAEHNMWWGASLNSLFVPSVFHPLGPIRTLSRLLYTGPYNESGVMNFGLVTAALALVGSVIVVRNRRRDATLIGMTLCGMIFGMGLLLRWNGEVVSHSIFRPVNSAVWALGHAVKPHIFPSPPPAPFESGAPLPGFFLTAVVPFYESARTVSRYTVLGMLGAVVLAGIALERLPRAIRVLLMALWLIEILPSPTRSVPVPLQPHPAYAWLAEQSLEPGEGIADISYPTLRIGGEVVWATALHGKPTVSGAGSFWPEHTFALWNYLIGNRAALSRLGTGLIFRQYGIRYLFLHILGEGEKEMWTMVEGNLAFRPVRCFDPLPNPTPWPYPICVAEVNPVEDPIQVVLQDGWSGREDWGVWAEGRVSRAGWLAPVRQGYRLWIGAFPLCVPGKHQRITIKVNEREIDSHRWENCEWWEEEIPIPEDAVRVGWNIITFEYEYALSPAEVTQGKNPDGRILSVGFTRLEVER